jgi:8-oxo-dGTP pyrophosphatase MutT (NUDIX family)
MLESADNHLRDDTWPLVKPGERYRRAAVLMLIYPRGGEDHMVFMKRTETVGHHKGQISLPGGAQDPTDADLVQTALREAQEELGVDPAAVEVIGRLRDIFARVSGFLITPVIARLKPGYLAEELTFTPSADEVAEVIEVPLSALRDEAIHHTKPYTAPDGLQYDIHYYTYGPYEIWGATGRILYEFLRSQKFLTPDS